MVKARIYLDTTVPSAYLDARTPDRQRLTVEFWNGRLPEFEAVVSPLVLLEIQQTPEAKKRSELEELVRGFLVLSFDDEAADLSQEYVARGVFPEKYEGDANHVATAVVHSIPYFASWNFKHLVRVNVRREVNLINALKGYAPIEIVAPPEL